MANPALDTDFQISPYASGTGGLVTLRSLGVSNPHPIYKAGVTKIKLGDRSARYLGAPNVSWNWGFVQNAERDILRTYCTGASASVYIWTPTIENVGTVPNAAQRFLAQLWWPDPDTPEDPQTGRRLNFVLNFYDLQSV